MSDVSNISGATSVEAFALPEEPTTETLIQKGLAAISRDDFEQATDVIVQLDQRNANASDMIKLVQATYKKSGIEGKKLLDLSFQTITLSRENSCVILRKKEGIEYASFSYSPKTSKEGKALIEDAQSQIKRKDDTSLESTVRKIIDLYQNDAISDQDFTILIRSLCSTNIVKAQELFPLLASVAKIRLKEDVLFIQVGTYSTQNRSNAFLFVDVEKSLKFIAEEEDEEDRIDLLLHLASLHPSQAIEILALAHKEISTLTAPEEKYLALLELANAYLEHNAIEEYKALLPLCQAASQAVVEMIQSVQALTAAVLQAGAFLLEKNKAGFDEKIKEVKEGLSNIHDPEGIEEIENAIQKLIDQGDIVFGIDQIELHARKV